MAEGVEERLAELAQRAGLRGVPPKAVGAALCVLALAVACAAWRWWPRGGELVVSESPPVSAAALPDGGGQVAVRSGSESTSPPIARAWVHVVGAVRHPGLYAVDADARVDAAVQAAGGLLGNAAPDAVNLARKVVDGEQISVPTQDEARRAGGAPGGAAGGTGGAGAATPAKVNLNTATAEQLDALPGIGPATAAKIVADRSANGPYGSLDDLGRVSGIGPKRLEELKDLVSVP